MLEKEEILKKIESLTLKTYGAHKPPLEKEYMTHEELIAMSPIGAHQTTKIAKKFAKHREILPPVLKKALKYLYPAKNFEEKPPMSKYDSMVRKMSLLSLTPMLPPKKSPKRHSKPNKQETIKFKLRGLFDFPKLEGQQMLENLHQNRSKSTLRLPHIRDSHLHGRYSSLDFINCINYTGEAESEYLKTLEGQKEYKKLYDLTLLESGLYQELRIRQQTKNRVHYKRMPV
jgi:hypothetical protein